MPTEKAHGYQICVMCQEFAKLGISMSVLNELEPRQKGVFLAILLEELGWGAQKSSSPRNTCLVSVILTDQY